MTSQTSNQIPTKTPIACKACGGLEFDRSSSEQGAIVLLYDERPGINDEVIREGDAEFNYNCAECGEDSSDNSLL